MLFYITSRVISSVSAFLYPGYASYKTLSQRPASEEDLERWLMYWSVLGCIVGVEYMAEWLVSWLPFYYPIKTIFLLYLALPQTQGSSYLYNNHLKPFFHHYESEIDAALASLKNRVYTFLQAQLRSLWDHVASTIGQQTQADLTSAGQVSGSADVNTGAPPSLNDPVSGPTQLFSTIWRSYGPSILASGAAYMRQGTAATSVSSNQALNSPPLSSTSAPRPTMAHTDTTQSVLERRRQLEAELASLPPIQMPVPQTGTGNTPQPYDVDAFPGPSVPIPRASPSYHAHASRTSSDSDLRERTASNGRFEEVEVPSDAEGYDTGSHDGQGYAAGNGGAGRPPAQKRTSWFFGWGAGNEGQGYERLKTD